MSFLGLPVDGLLNLGNTLIDRLIPDPQAKADAKLKLLEMQQKGDLAELTANTQLAQGQIDINKAEAANPNVFVSGWRPFIGWVCGVAIAYHFVVAPFLVWALQACGVQTTTPVLDIAGLFALVTTMLGLGAQRSFDKYAGVDTAVGGKK